MRGDMEQDSPLPKDALRPSSAVAQGRCPGTGTRVMNDLAATVITVAVSCALAAVASDSARAQGTAEPLVLEAKIPLKGVSGRIDHLAVDLARARLFVAELGNNTVAAIDLGTGRSIRRLEGFKEPQGVAHVPATDVVVLTSGGDGSVRFFNAGDLAPLGRLDLGEDADNVRVILQTGRVVVGYGAGALAVIDTASRAKIAEAKLAAHPEGFQLTQDGTRAFVNVPDAQQIAVVDLRAGRQIAAWPISNLRANFPMAIDASGATLAVVFRSPPRLVLLDSSNGKIKAQLETCGDSDDVFFDDKREKIYVSCGEGAVDVFQGIDASVRRLARIKTATGARTSLFVPGLDGLFVAARAGALVGEAAILVLRPQS